jgi:hypothetical protein
MMENRKRKKTTLQVFNHARPLHGVYFTDRSKRWVLVERIDAFEIHNRAPLSRIYLGK